MSGDDLLDRVVLPLASPEDARTTCRAAGHHLEDAERIVAVHVIEKAGGAPDKASVEQREAYAEEIFDAAEAALPDVSLERDVRYGTDVVEAIFDAAADVDATAVVVATRGGNRFVQLLTGDVAHGLITDNDRPVVVLPHDGGDADEGSADATSETAGGSGDEVSEGADDPESEPADDGGADDE